MAGGVGAVLRAGVIGGLLASGAGAAIAASGVVEQSGATASYSLTLDIGPMEQMLTAAQAQSQHATSGEIMAAMPGMPMTMAMGNHHVEVHVMAKNGGMVVKDATVAISLTDLSDRTVGTVAITPIMAMYGVAAGQNDWHYGNNAQLPDGTYSAVVTVNGQQATFTNLILAGGTTMATGAAAPMPAGTGAAAQMPAAMAASPAQVPTNTAMPMPATSGTTSMATPARAPSQLPSTGAGGAATQPVALLAALVGAFGLLAGGRRKARQAVTAPPGR